jgi:hypothetical protein
VLSRLKAVGQVKVQTMTIPKVQTIPSKPGTRPDLEITFASHTLAFPSPVAMLILRDLDGYLIAELF